MGGDRNLHFLSYTDDSEESSLEQNSTMQSGGSPVSSGDLLGAKVENGETGLGSEEFENEKVRRSISYKSEINRMRARNIYREVLKSYDEQQNRDVSLENAKLDILGYTPGSWLEGAGDTELSDYKVPKSTAILLVGPEGSGKSTLINKISDMFENGGFRSQRAQVSFNRRSTGCGTCFLQEYMIPRYSKPLCLYDTRSLSDNSSENKEMLKRWMTEGVCHGEPVMRSSDDMSLKIRMEAYDGYSPVEVRPISFVVFVVNALSVFESMEGEDETKKPYTEIVSTAFNSPFLWFKDDKPVVVVTHGDLLSLSDRIRVRIHLGELLGIHPKKQIFDISESDDYATKLAILEMLHYCLDHADKNLPFREDQFSSNSTKTNNSMLHIILLPFVFLVILPVFILSSATIVGRRLSIIVLLVALPLWVALGYTIQSVFVSPSAESSAPDAHNFQDAAEEESDWCPN